MAAIGPMITAQQTQASGWPERDASAYVNWWKQAEYRTDAAGPCDADLGNALSFAEVRTFQKKAVTSGDFGTVTAGDPRPATRRTVPLWPISLPPVAAPPPGGDPSQQIVLTPILQPEFGQPLAAPVCRPLAVMVVIDKHINPLHEQFRGEQSRPRILAHWLMEGAWRADTRVPFGREVRQEDFRGAAGQPTEEAGLRDLGVANLVEAFASRGAMLTSAHGTSILALAAGTDPQDGSDAAAALRNVPILAVSLPSNRLLSASGVFLDGFVDLALEWVTARLAELFGDTPPPVVVNLSYGLAAGPKDGSGDLNERLRGWLQDCPQIRLFMPAGNDGLARGHAVLDMAQGKTSIGWFVPPSDPLSTFAEVWFSHAGPDCRLHLGPPGQDKALSLPLLAGTVFDLVAGSGTAAEVIGRVYVLPGESPFKKVGCLVCIAPTRPRRLGFPKAPAGEWEISVSGPGDLRAAVSLQSERSLTPYSRESPAARLVGLTEAGAHPQRDGTLNAIGPGTGAIMVNGLDLAARRKQMGHDTETCRLRDQDRDLPAASIALARWTSRGDPLAFPPTTDGVPFPADRSRTLSGLLAPGYRSGTIATVEGTSFSTALASRAALLALILPGPSDL